MNNEQKNIILHLSLIEGIGPASIAALIAKESEYDSLTKLYEFSESDVINYFGFSAKTASLLVAGLHDTKLLEDELNLIEKHAISCMTAYDQEYPVLLKHIHVPPPIIYWRGTMPQTESAIAIVGARNATAYGKKVVTTLVPELVRQGFTIVSGGAIGVDTFAHECALASQGKTIVVLGSGLLQPYPSRNKKLFEEIIASGGALISSFAVRMEPLPGNFPARNRIISGLSKGCLVVQAAAKSGSLITANYALNQGRDVFAIPGPIDDPLSAGCHALIAQGASLVTSAKDILRHFGSDLPEKSDQAGHINLEPDTADLESADPIITFCRQPRSFDELLLATKLNFVELQGALFDLQIAGKIMQNGAGLWERL